MEMCPGQNLQFMDPKKAVYEVKCPACNSPVEFWYDDKKRRCDGCGEVVQPELDTLMQYQSCSSYCASARECLGDKKYVELILKEKKPKSSAKKELEDILEMVPGNNGELKSIIYETLRSNAEKGYIADINSDFLDLKENNEEKYSLIMSILNKYVLEK